MFGPRRPDGAGGVVVRIYAHAAGTQDHIHPQAPGMLDGGYDVLPHIPGMGGIKGLHPIGGQLIHHHGGKGILDAPLLHLAARGQDGRRLAHKGQQLEQGFLPRRRLRLL